MNEIFKKNLMKFFLGLSTTIIGSLVGYQISMHTAGFFIGGALGFLIFIAMMIPYDDTEYFGEGGFVSDAMEEEKAAKNLKASSIAMAPTGFTAKDAAEGLRALSYATTTIDSETSTPDPPTLMPRKRAVDI